MRSVWLLNPTTPSAGAGAAAQVPSQCLSAGKVALLELSLVHQPVELAGVFAGDLVGYVGRQVAELFGDVFRRIRPDAVGMRVVRAPHQGFDSHVLDQLGADAVVLER